MFQVVVKGLDEQVKKLGAFDRIASKHMRKAMSQSVITIEGRSKVHSPVGVSGRLRNSMASEVRGTGVDITGWIGSTLKAEVYPSVMEYGRAPGKMPPPEALQRWVHLRLGVPDEMALGVAFVIARKIGQAGIKGRHFLRRAYEESRVKIDDFFEAALKRITEELSIGL